MKKIIVLVVIVLSCFSQQVLAQSPGKKYAQKAVYAELGGGGIFYSLNFDYRFTGQISGRAGLTYWTLNDFLFTDKLSVVGIPLMCYYLVGNENHFFELGLGGTLLFGASSTSWFGQRNTSSGLGIMGSASLGYRYQPSDGGLFFRASIPLFFAEGANIWGGLGVGYAF